MSFIDTWNYIQTNLHVGGTIDNWSKYSQYFGGKFTISGVFPSRINVNTPGAKNIQNIPQGDFKNVYDVCQQYINSTYTRGQVRNNTRYSKYIISILKWVEVSNRGTLP